MDFYDVFNILEYVRIDFYSDEGSYFVIGPVLLTSYLGHEPRLSSLKSFHLFTHCVKDPRLIGLPIGQAVIETAIENFSLSLQPKKYEKINNRFVEIISRLR